MHWARDETPRLQDPGFGYFVSTLVRALRAGEPFAVWEGEGVNMVASPSLATACAEVMWAIADIGEATGIFHCCGSEATTRMQLAELACDVFDLDAGLLRSIAAPADATPGWPVPIDTSLTVDRTRTVLGYEPPSPTELLERFRSEMETGEMSVAVK
jgi:dTDP-4-dehydrorhamnose reductase